MHSLRRSVPGWTLRVAIVLAACSASAATIDITPADSYSKLEAAKAGDEVIVAPGTYRFRVHLTSAAPASSPILIHGKDPQNPPVWDLSASNVEDAPGSYTAGDRGRGCWQFSGAANIHLSDIVITGCHNADANSAGIRYYNSSTGIKLTNILFHDNDNGLTGGTQASELTAEFCEFARNGNLLASAPSHNIYIYGGTFALRYSYVHDPIQAQNFHIRAKDSTIEYNWFARAKSYAGDLMTSDDSDGSTASTQNMTFRGNVIVQGATQANTSQIIAVYNDAGVGNLTLSVRLLYNTFIGNGGHAALVHLSNADGTTMSATLYNNIIYGTNTSTLIEDTSHATVSGANNWLMTGATATGLTGSVFGSDPSFKNAAQNDYTLAAGSPAIGAALNSVSGLPTTEYYRDEVVRCLYRARVSGNDIGAFETTTQGTGIGPNGTPPSVGGATSTGGMSGTSGSTSAGNGGGTASVGGSNPATTTGSGNSGTDTGSCSCNAPGRAPTFSSVILAAALAMLVGARRQRR